MKGDQIVKVIRNSFKKKNVCPAVRKPLSYEEVIKRYEELSAR